MKAKVVERHGVSVTIEVRNDCGILVATVLAVPSQVDELIRRIEREPDDA